MTGRGLRRSIALCSLGIVLLSGCATRPVLPPLTEADLLNVLAVETFGETVTAADALRLLTASPNSCIDLHRPEESVFAERARDIGKFDRILIPLGLQQGFTNWHDAGALSAKPIDPAIAKRLSSATARLILEYSRKAAPTTATKAWPERCMVRHWMTPPIYQDEFAFVESGWTCGGLCGGGNLIALEYRNRRWRVVGALATWYG